MGSEKEFRCFTTAIIIFAGVKLLHAAEKEPVLTIFVREDGSQRPPGNPFACGWTESTACRSLSASLATYVHHVLRNESFPLQSGAFTTEINLMPNGTCHIEAGTMKVTKIARATNLVIKLANTSISRCSKANIHLGAPIEFEKASSLTLLNLRFFTAHSKEVIEKLSKQNVRSKKQYRTYLRFINSRNVYMEDCEFVMPAIFQAAMFEDTYPLAIHDCKFLGVEDQRRVEGLDKLLEAVYIEINQNGQFVNSGNAEHTVESRENESVQIDLFNNTKLVSVEDCQFHMLGAPPELYHSLDIIPSLHKASALRIVLQNNAIGFNVEIKGSNFTDIRSAVSSPVYVNISSNASLNTIFITDCFFARNEGFFGGALFVRFGNQHMKGSITHNYVKVQDTEFEKNFARQEGGAVYVRFSGVRDRDVQWMNSLAFRRVQFIKNQAGPKGTYPGAALLCKASSANKKPSAVTRKFKVDGYSGTLTFDSCTFDGNAGFGAFFTRKTNTHFTGNT